MKQTKTILLTAFIVLMAFTGVVYTSCHKDPCRNVACLNGGACSGGNCLCPSGYVGSRCEYLATTSITYNNNTFTPVTLTFDNSTTVTIPVGQSYSFNGSYGDAATATATTSGTGGVVLSWDFSDFFPATGTLVDDIDVSSDYFYLFVTNNSNFTIGQEFINYQLTSELDDFITIPNDDNSYGIGYYDAFTNSNLHLLTPGGGHSWDYSNLGLPFTPNQSFSFTAY